MNEIMWWFGQNALTALLMFPCVMVACRLFCDRPAVQHLLWLVILLKFVTPPIVAWPLSVAELRSLAWPQEANVEVASVEPLPELPRGVEFVAEPHVGESLRDSQHSASQRDAAKWRRQEAAGTVAGDATSSSAPVAPLVDAAVIALTLLATWLIGAIVCFVVQLRRLWRYARLIRCGEIAPLHLKEEVVSVASLLRMKPPVCIVGESRKGVRYRRGRKDVRHRRSACHSGRRSSQFRNRHI